MDFSLLSTLGLIFVITLIGAYVRSRVKDRCLRSWQGFHITLERTNGKLIWGVMALEATGIELTYLDSVQDEKHVETSYLLYATEYHEIQAIYRYADKLSEWGRKKRASDVRKSFHPNPLRRLGRRTRNFLVTATDSLNEVFNLVLGRVQKTGGRYLSDDGGAALKNLGGKVLGHVGGIYDPLLERYIGQRVVFELQEGNEVHEHVGIFKDYSADFIEVLDVQFPQRQTVALPAEGQFLSDRLSVIALGDVLRVSNNDGRPIMISSITIEGDEQLVNAVVDSGETIELHTSNGQVEKARLTIQIVRELDMILPRLRCVVRHRAENYRDEDLSDRLLDIIFDVGKSLAAEDARDAQEARLRAELDRNPKDALAAANLGCLLMRKDRLAEAEKWLRLALSMEYSLPDSGRRVRMELRELERRTVEESRLHMTKVDNAPVEAGRPDR